MTKYSEEELIKELQRVSEEYCDGNTPTINDMKEYGKYSMTPYRERFGLWNTAVEEAGFETNQPSTKPIKDMKKLKKEIIRLNNINNIPSPPRAKDMTKYGKFGVNTYKRRFGSWNSAVEASGLKTNRHLPISKKEIIEDIRRVVKKISDVPSGSQYNKHGEYSYSTIAKKFGWNDSVREAGFDPKLSQYTKDEIVKKIQNVGNELERRPQREEVCDRYDMSLNPFYTHFDGYIDALNEAGYEFKRDYMPSGEDHPCWNGGSEVFDDYGSSWLVRKREVLKRDGYECRICYSVTHSFDNPDVHHITPVRYWDVEKEHRKMNHQRNLICLCRSCHQKLEGKFKGRNHKEFEELAKNYLDIEETEEKKGIFDY